MGRPKPEAKEGGSAKPASPKMVISAVPTRIARHSAGGGRLAKKLREAVDMVGEAGVFVQWEDGSRRMSGASMRRSVDLIYTAIAGFVISSLSSGDLELGSGRQSTGHWGPQRLGRWRRLEVLSRVSGLARSFWPWK